MDLGLRSHSNTLAPMACVLQSYTIARELNSVIGGCGQMYEAIIVSPQFTKKTTLARHRLVNSTLKDEIAAIHAWTPKCHTPEEWEKKKPQ
jgi:stress-induced morphogen